MDLGLQADPAEASKAPLPVIEVTDLEATRAAVTAAGAAVTQPIFSFPGGRRFHFLDPSGNEDQDAAMINPTGAMPVIVSVQADWRETPDPS